MFDWIPLEYYKPLYYYTSLIIVLFIGIHTMSKDLQDRKVVIMSQNIGMLFLIGLVFYVGFRPVSGQYFGDMSVYANYFNNYQEGNPITIKEDVLFHIFTKICSSFMSVHAYFLTCAAMYIVPLYFVSNKWFKAYWFYAFLLLSVSFSFWAYGTNGIRNGIATSFFLLAISRTQWLWRGLILFIAVSIHNSVALPMLAYLLANFYTQPKYYLYFWIACIPISLVAGMDLQGIFAGFIDSSRTSYLTDGNVNDDHFSSTGFRWDFLLYSASAIIAGWYYVFKLNYKYKPYLVLYCTYLIANSFWILVIKANFSNRFAYLSWFMMALVIVFPLIKHKIMSKQTQFLVYVTLAYFGFTFFMFLISR
ncbi:MULTISPECIES: EpsG family protein [Capnocytophaga]|uniref:EpsG family protein n=1 Tax=Capnocytophaga TaxID=1016 RepID=UPI000BB1A03C|nr:EpsG family protein [Capnocytophaga sp. H2931]ATA74778.1 hypothetical protein CGC52_04615 [Capnocytophaga sp. H2931]